jgi:filamentous hemagglutinin family protein
MNHIYRLVWSHVLAAWVAIAESGSGRGKSSSRKLKFVIAPSLTLYAALTPAAPLDGLVVSGVGHIATSGATTTIQQATQNLSLSWKSFDVAAHETVNFAQPSSSAIAVNRIADINGSQILGKVNANGQVYLINPNGILFGQDAQVDVGSLVASTLDINDASMGSNARLFSGTGAGNIVNQGTIQTTEGGYVALLGQTVSNEGIINAPKGAVVLGGASAATLTFQDHSLVSMQVDESVLNTLAENGGLVKANGGMVIMNAGAKNTLLASVVNNTGVIEARTVENREGSIVILGGMAAGTANISGTLDASAPDGGKGGFIETSAADVLIADDVHVTTTSSDIALSGTWLIDPKDFNIGAGETGSVAGVTPSGNISGGTLTTALSGGNVSILSSQGTADGLGDINVNDAVSWSANKLTLTAANNININAVMSASGSATLDLNTSVQNGLDAATPGGSVLVGMDVDGFTGRIDFGSLVGAGILKINNESYTVINSLGTAGSTGDNLQGVTGATNYALGGNIDAAATSSWNLDQGFSPITGFTGRFNGLGHTVSDLFINRPTTNEVGLFGSTSGVLSNVGMVNAHITGAISVGALVGATHLISGRNFSNNYAKGGVVHGTETHAGGLVGRITLDDGNFANNFATNDVAGIGGTHHGGLVGWITTVKGDFKNNYATGNVSGGSTHQGGLVGWSTITTGNFTNNFSTGDVTGTTHTGGLAGWSLITTGNLSNNYATGSVTGTTYTAGLVGWSTITTGNFTNSYSLGEVTASTVPFAGLVKSQTGLAPVSSYWDTDTSKVTSTGFGVGKTTAQMKQQATYVGWDFTNIWYLDEGTTRPILRSLAAPVTVTPHDITLTYNGSAFTGGNGVSYSDAGYSPTGTLSYAGTSQGAVNAGEYGITAAGLISNQQYLISYTAGTLIINPKVVALSASKVYDGLTSLDGFVSIATGVGSENLAYSGAVANAAHVLTASSIGAITLVNATDGSGGLASNYVLPTLDAASAAVTITPAQLTASATITGADKVYDGFLSASTSSINLSPVSGLISGDTSALDTSGILLAFSNAHVTGASNTISASGSAAITISSANSGNGVSGQVAGLNTDYAFTLALPNDVTNSTITAKQLSVTGTIAGADKTYDGLLVATGSSITYVSEAALNGDVVTADTSGYSLAFYDPNVAYVSNGIKATGTAVLGSISNSTAAGDGITTAVQGITSDYTITAQPSIADVSYRVLARPLTVAAVAADKVFDGSDTAAVTLSDNRVVGDALTILNSAANFADASVGSKVVYVTGISVTGDDASNYSFNTVATTVAASISALPTPAVSTDTVVLTDSPAVLEHSGEGQRQIKAKSKTENGGVCNGSSVSQEVGCGAGFSAVFPLASADITAALSGTYDR